MQTTMFSSIPGDPTGWKVRSKSHPTTSHTVRRWADGRLSCSCPATVKCWHLKEFERTMTAFSRPVTDPSDDDPFAGLPAPQSKPASRPRLSAWDDEDIFAGLPIPAQREPIIANTNAGWFAALVEFEQDIAA